MVIPSGVDTDRFAPLPAGRLQGAPRPARRRGRVVGIVTRMRVRKGVEEFLRAMAMVRERVPDVQRGDRRRGRARRRRCSALVRELGLDGAPAPARPAQRHARGAVGVRCVRPVVARRGHVERHPRGDGDARSRWSRPTSAAPARSCTTGTPACWCRRRIRRRWRAAIAEVLERPGDTVAAMGALGRAVVVERFSARAMVRQMEALYTHLLPSARRARPAGRGAAAGRSGAGSARGEVMKVTYLGHAAIMRRVRGDADPDGSVADRSDLPRHVVALSAARARRARSAADRLPVHLARASRSLRSADAARSSTRTSTSSSPTSSASASATASPRIGFRHITELRLRRPTSPATAAA